jgi:hypothetical protein
MDGNEFANALGLPGTSLNSSFHRSNIATHDGGSEAAANLLVVH